jgi:ankyrin repeat protein
VPQVTTIHIAARRGNVDLIKLLLPHVDVNIADQVCSLYRSRLKVLMNNVNILSLQWGFTALHYAAVARNKDAVFCLLSNGASAIITSKVLRVVVM